MFALIAGTLLLHQLQKTKIPARGLKPIEYAAFTNAANMVASKNQNPREGIETLHRRQAEPRLVALLQKTKIPARGLKPR